MPVAYLTQFPQPKASPDIAKCPWGGNLVPDWEPLSCSLDQCTQPNQTVLAQPCIYTTGSSNLRLYFSPECSHWKTKWPHIASKIHADAGFTEEQRRNCTCQNSVCQAALALGCMPTPCLNLTSQTFENAFHSFQNLTFRAALCVCVWNRFTIFYILCKAKPFIESKCQLGVVGICTQMSVDSKHHHKNSTCN